MALRIRAWNRLTFRMIKRKDTLQRRRQNAAHDPPSEHEEDDVDLVDKDRADERKDEDGNDWSEIEDEEHEELER